MRQVGAAEMEVEVASPYLHARFEPKLYERVMAAAESESLSLSAWIRAAVEERLGSLEREAKERAALLAEARAFLAKDPVPGDGAHSLVSRYLSAIEAQAGRISEAERRGRQRALQEIAEGALEPLDGAELTFPEFTPDGPPVALELAATPRRRGFLRAALATERARALLQALPEPSPAPTAAGLLGEARTRQLWAEAVSWPGWRRLFCLVHGIVPSAPSVGGLDVQRCYLGCSIRPEVA